ncbi:site-specific integrase [Nocardiopsis rhodophaea]|uniref:Site-specific integrase n=1 Tax=Nocardiopsis rhodophaea TaxID=280238 RepID=A0ABN2S766_9ACTN
MSEKGKRTRQPNEASTIYLGSDGYWHGRVTVGVKDDGKPDRRHRMRKKRTDLVKAVRELERKRDEGNVPKVGQRVRVTDWLVHWLENIAEPNVSENTYSGYRVDVYTHLIPGLGAHWLDKLQPEHLERFYAKMQRNGSSAGTAHHAHRTIRVALNEAVRRRKITQNPALLAKAPRLTDEEVEPYDVDEIRRIMEEAGKRRNSARWAFALALGLRQGEVLGLKWSDINLAARSLRIRRSRLRPKYKHGCGGTCGRNPGYCPQKQQKNKATKDTKSAAGRRPIGLPAQLVELLRAHAATQERERKAAGGHWEEGGWVFTDEFGRPLNPNTDYREWKALLKAAGVRDARLHDARHTAATVLLLLDVTDRAAMAVMGWSSASMLKRYQHVIAPVREDIANRVDGFIWKPSEVAPEGDEAPAGEGPDRGN